MVKSAPGPSGTNDTGAAVLTTAFADVVGGVCAARKSAEISLVPVNFFTGSCAVKVTVTPDDSALWLCQVPCHRPSLSDCRLMGISPLEKETVTPPVTNGSPQSSLTSTEIAAGH